MSEHSVFLAHADALEMAVAQLARARAAQGFEDSAGAFLAQALRAREACEADGEFGDVTSRAEYADGGDCGGRNMLLGLRRGVNEDTKRLKRPVRSCGVANSEESRAYL